MRCTKCEAVISDDVKYCNYCGTPQNNNESIGENRYLKEYVGIKYNEIKEKKFNVFALFFTIYYYLYRKMYSLFFAYILLALSTIFLNEIGSLICIVFRIIIAIKFNEIYLNKAEKEVEKIKNSSPDKSTKELLAICKKKGGVNTVLPFVVMGLYIMLIFVFIIAFAIFAVIDGDIFDELDSPNDNNIEGIIYKVPNDFEQLTSNYFYFNDDIVDETCYIKIDRDTSNYYKTAEDFLREERSNNEEIKEVLINDNNWKHVIKDSKYFYAIDKNNSIYEIVYYQNKDKGICNTLREKFMNSIYFESIREENEINKI